jgi:hypothetical protein
MRSCLGANATMSCDTLALKLQDLNGVDPKYEKRHDSAGGQNFLCTTVADGCDCTFDYTESDQNASGDKGSWEVKNGVIYHYSESYVLTTSFRTEREADFCVSNGGQTLDLSGARGTTLSLKANLRGLKLQKIATPPMP